MSNRLSFRLAFRTFTDAFKFDGRSTRTQVVAFQLLTMLANVLTVTTDGPSPVSRFLSSASIIWSVVWGFPWIALFVRRLHDQDRSGWWAMTYGIAAIPIAAILALPVGEGGPTIRFGTFARTVAWTPWTITLSVVFVGAILVPLILLFLPETPGDNRFGPDPRPKPYIDELGLPAET
ncbi:uncharacterized membrane protein YhaH (DUF805 family) [Sphingomonas sp. UYAg733]